ncbi:transposase [Billgrantia sp. Q4P2]|uniref:transposase n=1 Tax=Billgrantia sp. Q4P2 TaxID=3463857 RepID=UPI0040561132
MAPSPRRFSAIAKQRNVEEINRLIRSGLSMRQACLKVGIHPNQFQKWKVQLEAYKNGDSAALEEKSKRPKKLARKTSEEDVQIIINLARSGLYNSAHAITQEAIKILGRPITTGTVIRILEESGDYGIIEVKGNDGRTIKRKAGLIKKN